MRGSSEGYGGGVEAEKDGGVAERGEVVVVVFEGRGGRGRRVDEGEKGRRAQGCTGVLDGRGASMGPEGE